MKAGLGYELHAGAIRTPAMDGPKMWRGQQIADLNMLTCVVITFTDFLSVRGKCQHNTALLLFKGGRLNPLDITQIQVPFYLHNLWKCDR